MRIALLMLLISAAYPMAVASVPSPKQVVDFFWAGSDGAETSPHVYVEEFKDDNYIISAPFTDFMPSGLCSKRNGATRVALTATSIEISHFQDEPCSGKPSHAKTCELLFDIPTDSFGDFVQFKMVSNGKDGGRVKIFRTAPERTL